MDDDSPLLVYFPGSVIRIVALVGGLDFFGGRKSGASRQIWAGISHDLHSDVAAGVVHQPSYWTATKKPRLRRFDGNQLPGSDELLANALGGGAGGSAVTVNHAGAFRVASCFLLPGHGTCQRSAKLVRKTDTVKVQPRARRFNTPCRVGETCTTFRSS